MRDPCGAFPSTASLPGRGPPATSSSHEESVFLLSEEQEEGEGEDAPMECSRACFCEGEEAMGVGLQSREMGRAPR
jgi:hypothetical protein